MSRSTEANVEDEIDFKWGNKRGVGVKNKDVQFYESFTYEGVEYFLNDCAYFYQTGDFETSIGKLVRIFETPTHEKKVKVVWLFRPSEIRNYLGDYQPHWNELFLACGEGNGLSNVNSVEAIIGKCNVVCTAKDKRNCEPSEADLKMADFFFSCAFDVGRLVIVDKFADVIGGIKVEQFFNKKKVQNQKISNPKPRPKIVIKKRTDHLSKPHNQAEVRPENVMPKQTSLKSFPYKKRKFLEDNLCNNRSKESNGEEGFDENRNERDCKKRKITLGDNLCNNRGKESHGEENLDKDRKERFCKVAPQLKLDKIVNNGGEFMEVTRRPGDEKRKWFKQLPWEERLRKAQELGSLILLNNLDPSYTSYEVEDLVWHALNERVEARMIEWSSTSNPHYGRAFVIFKTKDAAESAISRLCTRCLILGDGRAVTAEKGTVREPGEQAKFFGHLVMDRFGFQKQREEMRNAVSTSHCSQPNTLEYSMATDWRTLQRRSDVWWKRLYQRQMGEMQEVQRRLKREEIQEVQRET
ncbi:protein ANTI-SILENCING 1 isoform X1 [Senna tora]|uniref:Protein ANTI-SILENCING 1 isoform X1 n=1 Tax=Senna tora TaxID=362788 RepID=A0A834WEM5_9FABA|nr:protein ANTI-SILENCING 1 isoform X1 [Senna tora]